MNKLGDNKNNFPAKSCAVFVILTVLTVNCVFLTLMISKSVVINQENQILLERILALSSNFGKSSVVKVDDDVPVNLDPIEIPPQTPARLVQLFTPLDANKCTPCPTTPKPDPIEAHLNPIGILNEVTRSGATYECIHSCLHPVTHKAYLTIEDDCCSGITWIGVGKSKAASKHAAAYKALQEKFPENAEEVADEYIPPDYNPGPCQVPVLDTEKSLERKKC